MHEEVSELLTPDGECPLCLLWVIVWQGDPSHPLLPWIDDPACWNRRADGVTTLQRRHPGDGRA